MTYAQFLAHIESLEEYKDLRKRIHPYKIMEITAIPIIFRVDVTLIWGENEASIKDITKDCVIWDDERIVFSDPLVQEKIAEQKNAVKAYLKDLKALVKGEVKRLGLRLVKEGDESKMPSHLSLPGDINLEDTIHDLA